MELRRLESRTRRIVRVVTRAVVLVAGAVAALGLLPWDWAAMALPSLSAYVALGAAIGARALTVATPLGALVAAIVVFRPRWFCRTLCPTGLLVEQVGRLRPKTWPRLARVPPVGQWAVLVTLAGALVGYPLLLWLDPLAMLAGFFSAWRTPVTAARVLGAVGLPLVLVLSVAWPFAWCRRLCPLGATQDLLGYLRRLVQRWRRRKDEHALHAPAAPRRGRLARRTVLAMAAGAGAGLATPRWGRAGTKPLRPPGAADEERFTGLCIRCGNCIRACPERIILHDLGEHGLAGLLTPVLSFEKGYCLPDCHRCTQVCPSGAIARLTLMEKERAVIGIATIDMLACFLSQSIECGACAGVCPYQAIVIDFDENTYTSTIEIDPALCNGCGACQFNCPTEPHKAIRVVPLRRDGPDATPGHQPSSTTG